MAKNAEILFPDYTLKVSPRARNVWIRVSVEKGIEVVVPRWYNRRGIPELLRKESDWIKQTSKRLKEEENLIRETPVQLPSRIHLRALGEIWQVKYHKTSYPMIRIAHNYNSTLTVSGNIGNQANCREALREWLRRKAEVQMIPWLRRLSVKLRLPFNTASVKGQNTIWASCSRRKNISVNYKLLMIPRELVRYVLIHELCHTVHLNHSNAFWALVERKEPDYLKFDRDLREAWKSLPSWVHK
ncbi:M48 family metallopeptidase [Candidatus Sumerlaeota bacterium]|nr:M48 family metallopeptidase [Candidatus Sumerlaeota bacterium]